MTNKVTFGIGALLIVNLVHAQTVPAASAASAPTSPAVTLDTACGAPGTGRSQFIDAQLITRNPGLPGLRVNAEGVWEWCTMPKPPASCQVANPDGILTWGSDGNVCRSAGAPATIEHGRFYSTLQQQGSMRGHIGLRCDDGKLSRVIDTCAPATECDTGWVRTEDGGKTTYSYDARPVDKRVPVGGYVYAESTDGKRMRIQCVAGSFERSPEPPPVRPSVPAQPKVVTCGSQEATGFVGHRYTRVRYAGLAVPVGTVLNVQGAQLICGADGKLKQDLSVVPGQNPSNPWSQVGNTKP